MTQSEFLAAALRNPANALIAAKLSELDLPDAWLVSGCLVQTVWNALTGRAVDYGINDYDVFYFDPDTSWEAEDAVIRVLHDAFAHLDLKVEARNQARVHLWYGKHFGFEIDPIKNCRDSIGHFASIGYCVGARLDGGDRIEIFAPHGLEDLFSFRIRPNRFCDNRGTHDKKAARALSLWPELIVEPW